MITQVRLKEVLRYDPETGIFIWIKKTSPMSHNIIIGGEAGGLKMDGYRQIRVDGSKYQTHRLAWLYMEGYFPEHEIDHENRIRHDNKWDNLRHVTGQCNARNRTKHKNNSSQVTGVYWKKKNEKWCSQIMVSGENIYLGLFTSLTEAVQARWNAEVKYDFPNCNTTSSAYNYLNFEA